MNHLPPKPRFTKEEIISVALDIARKDGENAITARSVANALGSSTRPLFTYFISMDELKFSVYDTVVRMLHSELEQGLQEKIPLHGIGARYIDFARREPNLYRMLFMSPMPSSVTYDQIIGRIAEKISDIYGMNPSMIRCFCRDLWIAVNGLCTAIITGCCHFTDDQLYVQLMRCCIATLKAYKEIPGFSDEGFDFTAMFTELSAK